MSGNHCQSSVGPAHAYIVPCQLDFGSEDQCQLLPATEPANLGRRPCDGIRQCRDHKGGNWLGVLWYDVGLSACWVEGSCPQAVVNWSWKLASLKLAASIHLFECTAGKFASVSRTP